MNPESQQHSNDTVEHSISIKIGKEQAPQKYPMTEDGLLALTFIDGEPRIVSFDGAAWEALRDGINNNLDEYLTSGTEVQRSAYEAFQALCPSTEVPATSET